MITCIIKDDGEPKVTDLTYDNMWHELKDIDGSDIMVSANWLADLPLVKTKYVSFVEADCLTSKGYFKALSNILRQKATYGRVGYLASAVGVNQWGNRFYGYNLLSNMPEVVMGKIIPNRKKSSTRLYPVQIGYFPGALVRTNLLTDILDVSKTQTENLVQLSMELSLNFWLHDVMVYVNPNTTYVTTDNTVNDIADFPMTSQEATSMIELSAKFKRELI